MLDRKKHEQILKNILKDIFTNPELQGVLAFKGGSCLYMFYGLDRFSVDLDFNLRSDNFDPFIITNILKEYIIIDDESNKRFNWFWLGSYEKNKQRIKLEISKRNYPDKYVNKDFYGITVPTMDPSYMFAHKLCAITDRKVLKNRDIYDAHFMFKKGFSINEEIIELRTGKDIKEYFKYLIDYINKFIHPNNIMDGLGELLDDNNKDSIKATLLRDILFDLKSRI